MRRFIAGLLAAGLVSLGMVGTTATAVHAASTPSASLTALVADPTANTGAFAVPVTGIPGQAFHPQNASDPGPVQSIGIGRIGIGRIGIGRIGIGRIGIGRIGIGRIGLVDATLGGVLLSDLPISYPHACADPNSTTPCTGWSAVLAGTGLEFAPTQNVTLLQVLQNATSRARFETLELSDLDLTHTALANLPVASVALAGIPLSHLALDPSRGATPLAQWCSVLAAPAIGRNCLTDFGIDLAVPKPTDDDITLVTLGLAGVNFDALPLGEVAVAGTTVLDNSPLGVASIDDLDLDAAGIGRIGIGRIGIGRIGIGRIGIGRIGIGRIGLNEAGIGRIDLDAAGIGRIGIGRIGIGRIGIGRIGIGRISLGSSATGATGIGRIGIGRIDLSASGIGRISLGDLTDPNAVIACPTDTNVFDCTDGTKTIGDVPANLLQGTLWDLFQALLPSSASAGAFANITIADIVDALLAGATEGDTITLTELVASLQVDSQTTIADLVENSPDAAAVELGALLAGLTVDAQNGTTLGELLAAIGSDPSVTATTVAQLLQVIANDLGISVEDLLIGLLGNQDLPWQQLDLGAVALQPYAQPLATPVNYTATLAVTDDGGGSLQDVVVTAKIPGDFVYVAGSAAPLPDPATTDSATGPVLTWTLPGLPAGTSSIAFQLRAGISEGSEAVSGEAHLVGGSAGTPVSATTTVADTQTSSNPANPAPMNADTLYLGHVDAQHTSNFFSLHVAPGQRASLLLGNLPADEDLILYDATTASPLRGAPSRSVIPVSDPAPSLTPAQQTLPPETLQDLPLVAGRRVYDVSAQRGFTDEQIDTGTLPGGDYLVQVASYNGSTSNLPYALRARVVSDPNASCPRDDTAFANRFAFPNDTTPGYTAPAPTGAVDTVVLMNPTRLTKTFGAGAVQPMLDALSSFLSGYGHAQLVRLDDATDPEGIGTAYDAWDRDPCSVDAANAVVRAIGHRLDTLVAANPSLRFVVLAGSDNQIPMGRLRDATRIANERGRATDFPVPNELTSSLANGFVLTDDVYAQQHPIAVGGRDLFVPDLRVGRLVERPDAIAKALTDFTTAHGVLPSSATSLATGYDFLKDGAQQIAGSFGVGGHNPQTLINDTWTRADLANALSQSPAITSLNAHFDEQNILPAIGNADHSQTALFTVQDAEALPSLQGELLFSMGCHSGLNLPNEAFGANADTKDWAEFMASAGALWIANTGYGYGDTDTVALSEKLMSLLADQLDHSSSIGDALTIAKQRYAASLAVVSPYDEKALMESTFYGLPMWSLPSPATPATPLGRPGVSSASNFNANVRVAPTNTTLNPTFVSADGSQLNGHYEVNGQTQVAPQRPIQPRFELDVSPDPSIDPSLNGLVAKGALVTSLTSKDVAGLKPDQFRPAIDNKDAEQAAVVGDATFPAGIQAVTTFGRTQHLVLVPGQFRPTPGLATPGRGTERLFTKIGSSVFYGQPNDADTLAPEILTSAAAVSGQSVVLTATVTDPGTSSGGVKRVVALVTQAGAGAGTWSSVDLHPSASPTDPPNTWVGTFTALPTAGNPVDYYMQAVDNSGNVAASSSKGAYFNA
ncbi:MAG: large repetitive protein, partial [Actinomycetota bacterium]|nr:large repetitive protein [Actinomycetota bacterium]